MDDKKINDLILNITGNKDKPAASITNIKESDSIKVKTNITVDDENITLTFKIPKESKGNTSGEYKLSGYFSNGRFLGKGTLNNIHWIDWTSQKNISN